MTTVNQLLVQIGNSLKLARNSRKVSVKGHCNHTKQPESNYINYEKGVRSMSLAMLIKLAGEHNCDVTIKLVSKKQGSWK